MNWIPSSYVREVRRLGLLGAPLMVAQMSQMGMSVIDIVITGRYAAVDLAGVSLGTGVFWPVMLLLTGMIMAVTPTVAQLYGSRQIAETGPVARQALWLAVILAVVVFVLLNNVEPLYWFLGIDPLAIPIAVDFLHAQSFGVIGLLGYLVFRNLCEGLGLTLPTMLILVCALVVKIPLTYCFVFGIGEFEGLGGEGCGWSTSIIMWLQLFGAIVAIRVTRIIHSEVFKRFDLPNWKSMSRLARLGVPMGMVIFVEVAFFSSISLLVGRLGVEVLAAHQIAMTIASVGFMIPLALSMASTIRVGANVGARRLRAARTTIVVAMVVSFLVGLSIACVLLAGRHSIPGLFSDEVAVVSLASTLLLVCALFQLFDATQVTAIGALRGFKDATVPLFINLFSYWALGMPFGAILTFGYGSFEGIGVIGFWFGLTLGLGCASFLLLLRLRWITRHADRYVSAVGLREGVSQNVVDSQVS